MFLACKRSTGDLYAIKVIRKIDMLRKNQLRHVQTEKAILHKVNNPFLVTMYYSFQARLPPPPPWCLLRRHICVWQ